jgi:integral membrane sensor domain MASE1
VVESGHLNPAARKLLLPYLALPLAYVIAGRLGLLLAISPGYATAVFIPAGIAIVAAFVGGASTLPSTFIGSFLLNLWVGQSVAHELDATRIIAAAIIALASAVQAGVGGVILRRAIGYPAPLDTLRDVSSFLLACPVICLTSATLSNAALWALGVVPSADLAVNWMTWWIGDTLGVLVILPLMFLLVGQPRDLWRLRVGYVAVPMVLCFALFVAIFIKVREWEAGQSLAEFALRSQQLADTIKADLEEQALFLEQLSTAFISRKGAVDRTDFHGLASGLIQRLPSIQAVEWAPRIETGERNAFETAQRSGVSGFEVRERDASGAMRSADDRPEYYPVTYIEPLVGNEAAEGFDLNSDAARRTAITAAISSGNVIATAPIRLAQEQGDQAGILLIRRVSGGPTGPGVVLTVLRIGAFTSALAAPEQSALGLRFLDASTAQPLSESTPGMVPAYQSTLDFGARRYLIQTAPSPSYLAQHRGWQSWLVLAGGVLGTGLLGAFLLLGTGYAYRLRTKERELERIIDRTPFMLTRCSKDLHYQFVSQSYATMITRRPEEVIGRSIKEVMGDDGFKTILPHVNKVLRGERAEYRGGPGCLNSFSASISGASAGVRLPRGGAAY